MVEHEIHHRGQIHPYLGMLGVPTPPPVRMDIRARARSFCL
ncbi:MAG TPA: DinB family protein [Candidatus Dormibacteraeota bacterium]|nr:DinB family protein [Candidatus Dormibacteraeota bacterium]